MLFSEVEMRGNRYENQFEKVCSIIKFPNSYFDFPSSLIAFAESLSSSNLFIEGGCLFRRRNRILTLISFCGNPSETLSELSKGFKIKVLSFCNKDFDGPKKKVGWDYVADRGWPGDEIRNRKRMRFPIRHCEKVYTLDYDVKEPEVLDCYEEWFAGAKERHFMVRRGHHMRYIQRYFGGLTTNVRLLGFRESTGRLYGIAGFEFYNGRAQLTLMKHRFGDNNFSRFFWFQTMAEIFKGNPERVFAGSSADKLKAEVGMYREAAYKIKL